MWCSACRQDVPGIAPPSGGVCCCARCGGALGHDDPTADSQFRAASDDPTDELFSPRALFDAWQLEDDESDAAWLLRPAAQTAVADRRTKAAGSRETSNPLAALELPPTIERPPAPSRFRIGGLIAWLLIAAGMTALSCGAMLAGWSVWEDRQELWTWGVPIAMGGQVALIVGLLMLAVPFSPPHNYQHPLTAGRRRSPHARQAPHILDAGH
ncbi:MAG: hypothetical protein HY000_20550 [Planctomycetes bacterium]|nr:hypothetical protein [Planctomycetota bacterium]